MDAYDEKEQEALRQFFRRLAKDPDIVKVGKVYVDVPGTIGRKVACSEGLCMQPGPMKRLVGKTCCTTFEVPVERADVERIAKVVDEVRKIRDVDKAIEKAGGWWRHDADGLSLERRPSGACVFLSAPKGGVPLCTIHEWALGQGLDFRDHKPETCCIFPLYTVEWGDEVLVTSYGTPYMREMEPTEADQIERFACTHPPEGQGRSVLAEQHDELMFRLGSKRWTRVLAKLRSLGHAV